MPTQVTYPGVYIEEIPSGVRTISGVATSIAAFIGWSKQGPTDHAQRVQSWSDFERYFGGLDFRSYLGYAVYQFFQNGGQDAYVIRLAADDAVASTASLPLGETSLSIEAKNPGTWGDDYGVKLKVRDDDPDRFRIEVMFAPSDAPAVVVESFENLSATMGDRRYVETVINAESMFIKVDSVGAASGGTGTDSTGTGSTGTGATGTGSAGTGTGSTGTGSTGTGTTGAATETNAIADAGGTPLVGGAEGTVLSPGDAAFTTALGLDSSDTGVKLLDYVDLFNLLCVPGETDPTTLSSLQAYCRQKRAFLIADCEETATFNSLQGGPNGSLTGNDAINAAFYFPWIDAPDPMQENRPRSFPPCGFVAGLYAKTDASRGVFKAPAGTDASLAGVIGVSVPLTDAQNGVLNPQAINCIRNFPIYGTVIWGARTLRGNNEIGSEWKYVPVRRITLFIEETLYRGTKWAVFEPNDEPLWAQLRLNIGAFMNSLFRQGTFQGRTPQEAYFVKCDAETTTQNDINLGIVNVVVGFAPLKPAEFVVIKIQQIAGQIAV
ncbi:MAG: phage tail sheath subtilisin-like domain-containing protein [Cyanobacteria bacterium P01_D01_bin.6]